MDNTFVFIRNVIILVIDEGIYFLHYSNKNAFHESIKIHSKIFFFFLSRIFFSTLWSNCKESTRLSLYD